MKITLFLSIGLIFLFLNVSAYATFNLVVYSNITGPDSAEVGDIVTFHAVIKSVGGPATNVKVRGGIIRSAQAGGNYLKILEKTYPSIPADTDIPISFTWKVEGPPDITPSAVYFQIFSTEIPLSEEDEETDNFAEKPFEIKTKYIPKPDLISTVQYIPIKFKKDDKVEFKIKIKNLGDANSSSSKLYIKHGATLISDINIFPIPKGGSSEVTHYWLAKCDEVVTIIVDATNKIDESNESNNAWVKKMNCGSIKTDIKIPISDPPYQPVLNEALNKPDLIIIITSLTKADYGSKGIFASVDFKVKNIGKVKSNPCKLTAQRGGMDEMFIDIPSLEPGKTHKNGYSQEYVRCQETSLYVDSDQKNDEIDETNNIAKKKLDCIDPIDPKSKKTDIKI